MSDMSIDDATQDASVGGGELIPVSDAGSPKSVSVEQIKDFVLAKIAGITNGSAVTVGSDGIYVKRSGALVPVPAETVAAAVLDYAFSLTAVVAINGNEKVSVKDGVTKKTVTLGALKEWLENVLDIDADFDISSLGSASTPLNAANLVPVSQSGTNKKLALADISAWILARLASTVADLTAVQTVSTSDILYLVSGGNARKMTVAQLVAAVAAGDVKGPDATTENNIPQWDSVAKKLKNGLEVVTSIAASPTGTKIPTEGAVRTALDAKGDVKAPTTPTAGAIPTWGANSTLTAGKGLVTSVGATGSNDNIPTEKAVRDAIADASGTGAPSVTTENYIPQWDSVQKKLKNGLLLVSAIRSLAEAADTAVPTEKAVRTLVNGLLTAPVSHTENAIPQWGAGNELKAGKSVVTTLGSTGSDDNIPTEKAVRDAIQPATNAKDGLMTAADKAKLDGLADTGSVAEIGENLSDGDTIVVRKGDSTYRKSLLSRFWTYIAGKLSSFKIDDLAVGDDNTDGNATDSRHGLLRKLDGNTEHFLRGDGEWETPAGSSDFTGDSGTGGSHGLVPAPASGDAAANKFLCANGTWAETPAAAGVDIPGATAIDALAASDAIYVYDASESGYRKLTAAQLAAFLNGLTRYDTIFIPAGAFAPSTVGGAAMSALRFTNNTHDVAAFPADEDAFAEFNVAMPDDWDGLPVKAKIHWTCNNASAEQGQTAVFTVGAVAFDDGDAISNAPTDDVESVSDALDAVNELHVTGATGEVTPDGIGSFLHFRLGRDVSEGTLTQAVQVLGVMIQFGRTSGATRW